MRNLRRLREAKRITQVRLSIEVGVAQGTISAYESNKAMPSVETLIKMADFLHTTTDVLLDRVPIAETNATELTALTKEESELIASLRAGDMQTRALLSERARKISST